MVQVRESQSERSPSLLVMEPPMETAMAPTWAIRLAKATPCGELEARPSVLAFRLAQSKVMAKAGLRMSLQVSERVNVSVWLMHLREVRVLASAVSSSTSFSF
jgi:hypothetical protein